MLKPLSLLHHYEHSYLELHGAFSIALCAPGAPVLSRFGYLAGRGAREIVLPVALGSALRAGTDGMRRPKRFRSAIVLTSRFYTRTQGDADEDTQL
jgi:hypothetical protein